MSEKRVSIGPFLLWVAANLLGWLILAALVTVLPALKSIRSIFTAPILIGVPLGLAQWLVLRRLIPLSPLWVLAFPVGWVLSMLVPVAIPASLWQIVDSESAITLTILYIVMGAVIGLPQWLMLRRRLTKAAWWILGSSVGMGLGFALVLVTGFINRSEFWSYTVVVLVYGIATGAILLWLLRQKAQALNPRLSAT